MPKAAVKLIITGDDFGYCPRRNQGIVDCFLAGAVSNVSLLVNGSAAADAVQLARSALERYLVQDTVEDTKWRPSSQHGCSAATGTCRKVRKKNAATVTADDATCITPVRHRVPIGLHANLSEGSPVCPALKGKSSLLNEDGYFHGKMGIRTALAEGLLNLSEVKQELKAQVDLFRELTGHLPHHMDGHQHVHVLPEIRQVFAQVLEDYGITYTRVPIEPDLPRCDWIDPALMAFYLGVEKDSLNTVDVFRKHGIRWPDIYIGLSTMGKNMSVVNILSAIDNATAAYLAKDGNASVPSSLFVCPEQEVRTVTIELMTHPGYPSLPPVGGCGEGPDEFSQSWERLHELETLTDAELQSHYKMRNIQLCAFKDLAM